MKNKGQTDNPVKILKSGGIGVLATDTLYGLVGSALNIKTVERIYRVRKRTPTKPLIILISRLQDLDLFEVKLNDQQQKFLAQNWPGPVSVILPCPKAKYKYLHRGTKTLAFRLPKSDRLIALLKKTGPLVAPSANPEDLAPAITISEARAYFTDQVDFYQAGKTKSRASKLVALDGERIVVLRA